MAVEPGTGRTLRAAGRIAYAGMPAVAFSSVMEEARLWCEFADLAERKAYLVACFESLSEAEREAFLAWIGKPK